MDEAVVGRVRDLRDEVKDGRPPARRKNRIESARDAIASEKQALTSARRRCRAPGRTRRRAAPTAKRRWGRSATTKKSWTATSPRSRPRSPRSWPKRGRPAAGRADQGRQRQLIWPVDGPVVSGFGSRTINGSYEYHPGSTSPCPGHADPRRASGTVIFTESEAESGGYGNYTCIDHGGGLSTCYAHQESFAVSLGQQVSQGQIIGLQRLHRLLLRTPSAFRGSDQRLA